MRFLIAVLLLAGLGAVGLAVRAELERSTPPAAVSPGLASAPSAVAPLPAGAPPPANPAQPSGPRKDSECAACHRERQPGLMAQWDESTHARVGVKCTDCHGTDHEAMFADEARVPAMRCRSCHEKQTDQFLGSVHAKADVHALANARLLAQIPAIQRRGCMACHDSGGGEQGRCNGCHGAHRHMAADARRPEACGTCHMGPDHPHLEAWEASLHGVVYGATHDEKQAPTCATCHMPKGTHDVSGGITIGRAGSGSVLEGEIAPIPMQTISKEKALIERDRMLKICQECHTPRVSRRALEDADDIKREADRLVGEAVRIVRGLHADGLLDPMPESRPPHPTAGHALVLGGGALYENHSEPERIFFDLAKFAHAITFKSAYHQSADYLHWLGIARLKGDLEALKAEERRLRK